MVVALALGLAACGESSFDELKGLPELGLHPVDSQSIAHHENPAERTIDGVAPATIGDIFATSLMPADVLDYYDDELVARGYTLDQQNLYGIRTTVEDEVRAYTEGDVIARVAIVRADDPRTPDLPTGYGDGTMFALSFIAPQ